MARFNTRSVARRYAERPDATLNYGGGLAFKPSDEMELYLRTVATFLGDKYYRKETDELRQLQELVRRSDYRYVLALAAYARNEMDLRTLPQILLAEAAGMHPGKPKPEVAKQAPRIMLRADEPGEVLAYYRQHVGQKIPMALRRGICTVLNRQDAYEFKKYQGGRVSQRLLITLMHPDPRKSPRGEKEQSALFKAVLDRTLPPAETWETVIATEGSTPESWNKIAPKMGIFALLRNLRNFEKAGADKAIDIAIKAFHDKDRVLKSRILPFRWYEAAKHVSSTALQDALRDALEISVESLPKFEGSAAVLVDMSGSMSSRLSNHSRVMLAEVAALMGAIAHKIFTGPVDVYTFATESTYVPLSSRDSVLTNAQKILSGGPWGATFAGGAIKKLNKHYDRIVMLSDMQCYSRGSWVFGPTDDDVAAMWERYKKKYGPSTFFSIDLSSYGTLQIPEDDPDVVVVGGFSERIFDMIKAVEGRSSVVEEIKRKWMI